MSRQLSAISFQLLHRRSGLFGFREDWLIAEGLELKAKS
jgi:hypothetical protein